MKKLLSLILFIPFISIGQNPTVIATTRFFPKNDKIAELEKGLKNHSQTYHTGDHKWRVYDVQSGPDAGAYMCTEGPSTWDQVDKRGNLGAEHMNDLYKNVMPYAEKVTQSFAVYREELSTLALTDFSEKIAVTHVNPRPGRSFQTEDNIKQMKKVWEESKQNVVVYEMSSSGPIQYLIVTRYKDGLKEREANYRKPISERFNTSNGDGSFEKWLASISDNTESQWGEMLFYNTDLSGK